MTEQIIPQETNRQSNIESLHDLEINHVKIISYSSHNLKY